MLHIHFSTFARRCLAAMGLALLFSACQMTAAFPSTPTPSPTASPIPPATPSRTPTPTRMPTRAGTLPIWAAYPSPQSTPATPIPTPLSGLTIPDEVRVGVLLGTDQSSPYVGRSDAMLLVIYHPRLSRASLLSLPPDLFVYIPGHTMQRLNTAYSLGGARTVVQTLQYNFGLRPNWWLTVPLDTFARFIDDQGGLQVDSFPLYPPEIRPGLDAPCTDVPTGTVRLNGEQTLCYLRLRIGSDEISRSRRQQQVALEVMNQVVSTGALRSLPDLYRIYRQGIDTNLTADELIANIPLMIRVNDPNRIGFFQLDEAALRTWQIPNEKVKTFVVLPEAEEFTRQIQRAVDYVLTIEPQSDVLLTQQAIYTITPTLPATEPPTPEP